VESEETMSKAHLEIVAGLLAAFGASAVGLHDWHEALNPANAAAFALALATALRALNTQAPAQQAGEGDEPTDRE
jgi:hypothetical protein